MGYIESIFLGAFYDGRENCQGRWLMLNATILDLTVRSNSSKSSGLKSRLGSCPYAPVAPGARRRGNTLS